MALKQREKIKRRVYNRLDERKEENEMR